MLFFLLVSDRFTEQHDHERLTHDVHQHPEEHQAQQHGDGRHQASTHRDGIQIAIARGRKRDDAPPHGLGDRREETLFLGDHRTGDRIGRHKLHSSSWLALGDRDGVNMHLALGDGLGRVKTALDMEHQGGRNHQHGKQGDEIDPQVGGDAVRLAIARRIHILHGGPRELENAQNANDTQQPKDLRGPD